MVVILKQFWNTLGSINLTIILLLILVVDLGGGYFILRSHTNLFTPLNDLGLWEWMQTYGSTHLPETGWFFALLLLLLLLALNTFVCTTTRVWGLMKARAHFPNRTRFLLRFSPHIMHYAVIVILLGYLASYLLAENYPNNILIPGKSIRIPHTDSRIQLESLKIQYYEGRRLDFLQGMAINPQASLIFRDSNHNLVAKRIVSINQPAWFRGFSIHLKNFAPNIKGGGMQRRPFINLMVKKDPGLKLYFAGTLIFAVGLLMYLYEWLWLRPRQRNTL